MAWQTIGTTPQGKPLRRWVPAPGDPKPRKIKAQQPRDGRDWRTVDEAVAVNYARWLAERDGIAVPTPYAARGIATRCIWDEVKHPTETVKRKRWSPERGEHLADVPRLCPRIRAVEWGAFADTFTHRRDDARAFTVLARIDIPHWDHVPTLTVEHAPGNEEAAA